MGFFPKHFFELKNQDLFLWCLSKITIFKYSRAGGGCISFIMEMLVLTVTSLEISPFAGGFKE
jgi:hypothetical protein